MASPFVWGDHVERLVNRIGIQHLQSPETTLNSLIEWAVTDLAYQATDAKYAQPFGLTDNPPEDDSDATISDGEHTSEKAYSNIPPAAYFTKHDAIMLAAQCILFRALKQVLKDHKAVRTAATPDNKMQSKVTPSTPWKRKRSPAPQK